MARYLATPLEMTTEFFRNNAGYGPVGTPQDYNERQSIEVEDGGRNGPLEEVWRTFQNIDENNLCPDGGRSLMVGDLVRMVDLDGEKIDRVRLFKVASCGFEQVSGLKSVFPHVMEAMQNPDLTYEDIVAMDSRDPE